jgi:hypothetical protein
MHDSYPFQHGRSVMATLIQTVQNVTVTITPPVLDIVVGDTAKSSIVFNSNPIGLHVPINLSLVPSLPLGISASISSNQLQTPGTVTLSIHALAVGNYTVSINEDLPVSHYVLSVNVHVVDYHVEVIPAGLTVSPPGAMFTAKVRITPVNGFDKIVTLTAQTSSNTGLTVTVTPDHVKGSGNFTLSLIPKQLGNYTIIAIAATDSTSHNSTLFVTVLPAQHPISFLVPSSYLGIFVIGITAIGVVGIVMGVSLLIIRRKRVRSPIKMKNS